MPYLLLAVSLPLNHLDPLFKISQLDKNKINPFFLNLIRANGLYKLKLCKYILSTCPLGDVE